MLDHKLTFTFFHIFCWKMDASFWQFDILPANCNWFRCCIYVRNFWKEKAIWQKRFSSDWGANDFQDLCDFSFPKSHLFLDQISSAENAFPKKMETNQLNARKAFWSSSWLYDGSRSRFQTDLNWKLTVNGLAGVLFRITGVLSRLTGVLFSEAAEKFGLSAF